MLAVLDIDSEESAWAALQQLLDNQFDVETSSLNFSNADWLKFSLYLEGDRFKQSLTSSVMKGLVEYQFANYRSIALILRNRANTNLLSDEQKDRFELIFKISDGSTGADADGKGIAEGLNSAAATEAVKKMTKGQIFLLILVFVLMSYGSGMYAEHLRGITDLERIRSEDARQARQIEADDKKDERRQETIDRLIESDIRKSKLLERAIERDERAAEIIVLQEEAADQILKNTNGAKYVVLQGRKIDREKLDELNKQTRRRPKAVFFDAQFIIKSNSPLETGGFNLSLENVDTGETFVAALTDPLVIQKSSPIQKAEWNKKPVRLHIRAKDKGDGPYEAEIVRVFRQRRS